MNDFFKRLASNINSMWGNLTAGQKFGLVFLICIMIGGLVWLATPAKTSDLARIIGPEETIEVRAQVKAKLDEKNIRYTIENQSILVPRQDAEKVILDLAADGIFGDEQIFKFLKEIDLTATKWQQEKKWQVALQRKIESMIRHHNAIKDCTLQLTPPSEAKTLGFQGKDGSAAIVLTLKPNKTLSTRQLKGVVDIVAASSGLRASDVRVMDSMGRLYRSPKEDEDWHSAAGRREAEEEHVRWLEGQVLKVLQHYGEVYVAATVKLSAESSFEKRDKRVPDETVDISKEEKIKKEKSESGGGPPGIKGAESTSDSTTTKTDLSEKETKLKTVSSTVYTETKKPPGDVMDQSVSVVIPVVADDPNVNIDKEKDKVKALIENATLTKKEKISVEMHPFKKMPETVTQVTTLDKATELLDKYGGTVLLGLLSLISLFMLFRLVKNVSTKPKTLVETQTMPISTPVVAIPQITLPQEVSPEFQAMRNSIQEMVNRNPRAVAGVLRKWVFE